MSHHRAMRDHALRRFHHRGIPDLGWLPHRSVSFGKSGRSRDHLRGLCHQWSHRSCPVKPTGQTKRLQPTTRPSRPWFRTGWKVAATFCSSTCTAHSPPIQTTSSLGWEITLHPNEAGYAKMAEVGTRPSKGCCAYGRRRSRVWAYSRCHESMTNDGLSLKCRHRS